MMRIGSVAKRIGISIDAIRFYERNSLLPRPPRTPGGFRQYGESDIETLGFIRRAQRRLKNANSAALPPLESMDETFPEIRGWRSPPPWRAASIRVQRKPAFRRWR